MRSIDRLPASASTPLLWCLWIYGEISFISGDPSYWTPRREADNDASCERRYVINHVVTSMSPAVELPDVKFVPASNVALFQLTFVLPCLCGLCVGEVGEASGVVFFVLSIITNPISVTQDVRFRHVMMLMFAVSLFQTSHLESIDLSDCETRPVS